MTHHVILGGGPAGMNAIESIRRVDGSARITLVADESPYARMALPYFIAGDVPAGHLATASEAFFEKGKVELQIGRRATAIDARAHRVDLDDVRSLRYDRLLIATGSSPASPPIPGADAPGVQSLWTLADARTLLERKTSKHPTAVLVGGGFIGLIVLNALHKMGWRLHVVELEGQILPRMLDRRAAAAAEGWLRDRAIGVHTGASVTAIDGTRKKEITLSDDTRIEADLVILSTGIRPNLDLTSGADIETRGGLVVDGHCRTSAPDVYAAGDVAAGPDLLGGPNAVHAIQTTAVDHGRVAGAHMAGAETAYAGSLLMNVLDLAGLHCTSFGRWQGDAETTEVWAPERPVYRKLVWEADRLVGAIALGPVRDSTMTTDVGMIKGLIQAQRPLGRWKSYLHKHPWDVRRAFVASGCAAHLLPHTALGTRAVPRGFAYRDRKPRVSPGSHHADLVGTRPPGFESLPKTPTPGIYKNPT